jgi:hypothetical protein
MTNVFSFCVYGSEDRYCKGMIENIHIIQTLFPSFEIWIYYNDSLPSSYLSMYISYSNVKCIYSTKKGADLMMERLFAFDDASVDICFIRDADSRVFERDAWCIQSFLTSSYSSHIIRDFKNNLIQGGTLGLKKGCISYGIQSLYNAWLQLDDHYVSREDYMSDQRFLKDILYPRVKDTSLIHSSFAGFNDEIVYPIEFPRTSTNFVENVYEFDGNRFVPYFNIVQAS